MLGRIAGAVRFKEPLSFHTSLRLGGPAEFFVVPRDLEDVRYALDFADREELPVIVIGGPRSGGARVPGGDPRHDRWRARDARRHE